MRYVLVLLAGCAAGALPPTDEPRAALEVLDELNRWCDHQDGDCDVAMRPGAYPGQVAAGETNGWIASHRERLAKLGVAIEWEPGRFRFETQVEHDLRLMIGGNFTADALGPDTYARVLGRARSRPPVYATVLVERIVGEHPDATWLSSSYVAATLEHLAAPDFAHAAAQRLVPHFEAALRAATPPPASDEYRAVRLQRELDALRRL